MTSKEYIELAKRTEATDYGFEGYKGVTPRIEHGVIGIVTEAGELMDDVKKAKIYKKELDRNHLIEELGDVFWYAAILADELGVSFEEVWHINIKKLQARYPEKYTDQAALVRDIDKEIDAMHGNA